MLLFRCGLDRCHRSLLFQDRNRSRLTRSGQASVTMDQALSGCLALRVGATALLALTGAMKSHGSSDAKLGSIDQYLDGCPSYSSRCRKGTAKLPCKSIRVLAGGPVRHGPSLLQICHDAPHSRVDVPQRHSLQLLQSRKRAGSSPIRMHLPTPEVVVQET